MLRETAHSALTSALLKAQCICCFCWRNKALLFLMTATVGTDPPAPTRRNSSVSTEGLTTKEKNIYNHLLPVPLRSIKSCDYIFQFTLVHCRLTVEKRKAQLILTFEINSFFFPPKSFCEDYLPVNLSTRFHKMTANSEKELSTI